MASVTKELHQIQAIVQGIPRKLAYARHLYIRVNSHADGQQFLALLGPPTSIEKIKCEKDNILVNIAFTRSGLARLGVSPTVLSTFPEEFLQGMQCRAQDNGDDLLSSPEKWDPCWINRGIDIWIGLYSCAGQHKLIEYEAELNEKIDVHGLNVEICDVQEASRNFLNDTKVWLDDETTQPAPSTSMIMEHFGFNDGVTSTAIEGIWDNTRPTVSKTRVAGSGKLEDGHWKPLAVGEFLLGHIDEVDEIPIAPKPHSLSHNGTFLVLRKLYQHVDCFRKYVRGVATQASVSADYVAQKMIGRHRDGTNFIDPYRINNFVYKDDMQGRRCPLGAHIRRSNPRDTLEFETLLTNRHRIARRAHSFGSLVPHDKSEKEVNPESGQGLIFIAINASISRQFEFIQRQWLNHGNDLNQGDDRDPIVGNNEKNLRSRMIIPGNSGNATTDPTLICNNIPRFVDTRGGDYFFLPSLSAVQALSQGKFSEPHF